MKIKDESFAHLVEKIKILDDKLSSSPLRKDADLPRLYAAYSKKQEASEVVAGIAKRSLLRTPFFNSMNSNVVNVFFVVLASQPRTTWSRKRVVWHAKSLPATSSC